MNADGKFVYLDNNATTQLDPAVLEEMLPFLTTHYANPSSGYACARLVRDAVELARERLAALLSCTPAEIVFTSCGTESNNAAINSALQIDPSRQHIITTAVEHSAIRKHCEQLQKRGAQVTFLGVDQDGSLDLDELAAAIRPETAVISVMWANNETGVLFPVEKIADIARANRAFFHTDAVQAVGKIPIRLGEGAINFLSLSAHKLHGPKGVGALFVNRRSAFRPSIVGGSQENNRRAGTENVASIVALGKAAECAAAAMQEEETRVRAMRDEFENAIVRDVPNAFVNGRGASRLPNTSNLSFAGVNSQAALIALDRRGICCSAGSACKTGSHEASHVLDAMNLGEERARGSLRFSFGRFNTADDVEAAIEAVTSCVGKLRAMSPAGTVLAKS